MFAPMRRLTTLAALLLAATTHAGQVRTLDGKNYEGDFKIESGALLVTPQGGKPTRIELANILTANLRGDVSAGQGKAANGLPNDWKDQNVGNAAQPASTTLADGKYTMKGGGNDLTEKADAFHFTFHNMSWEGQMIARVASVEGASARAGLVLRDDNNPAGRSVALVVDEAKGVSFIRRAEPSHAPAVMRGSRDAKAPYWLRVIRQGNNISAYQSTDGENWDKINSEEIKFAGNVQVGLALASKDNAAASATFDHVSILNDARKDSAGLTSAGGATTINTGLMLRGGSVLRADIRAANDTSVKVNRNGEISVSTADVARIIFKPMNAEQAAKLTPGRTGVLLANGDFFEGDIRWADGGQIKLSSVLFGNRNFNTGEAVAVALNDVKAEPSAYQVTHADGSILMVKSITADPTGLIILEDQNLGPIKTGLGELTEIRAGASRYIPLTDLRPVKVATRTKTSDTPYVIDATTAGLPMILADQPAQHGIGAIAGATLTYNLEGNYKTFTARAGVPKGVLPVAPIKFIVTADGKELYKSTNRTSLDDPVGFSVNVTGIKTLELKIESPTNIDLGASGLWADPALIK